jgi:hypothetical protein
MPLIKVIKKDWIEERMSSVRAELGKIPVSEWDYSHPTLSSKLSIFSRQLAASRRFGAEVIQVLL